MHVLGVATVFPQTKGLTATFNDSQLFNIATVILDELRTKEDNAHGKDTLIDGFLGLTIWFPNLNIFREPHVDNGQERLMAKIRFPLQGYAWLL